jgi:ketosteroid isomerase-like protein
MSKIGKFAAYAAAFEKAYESNDWAEVERCFAEGAVYEVEMDPPMGGRFEGRAAILDYFRFVLDAFDRRFESRELALLDGPTEKDGSVWLRGSATYRAAGVPELVLELELTLRFDGEQICQMVDHYEPEMKTQLDAYLAAHGAKLGIPL